MKIKRWAILTAIFAFLGSTIVASGCQPSNTASTTNGGGVVDIGGCIDQCTQDCTDSCTQSCNESCANCQLGNGTYDCTTPEGCVTCWFDCGFILCSECISGATNPPNGGGGGGNTNNSSSQNSQTPSDNRKDLIEGVDYTIRLDGLNIIFYPLKHFSDYTINCGIYENATNTYALSAGFNGSTNKEEYVFLCPLSLTDTSTFNAETHTLKILSVKGIESETPIYEAEEAPEIPPLNTLTEGVDYTMSINELAVSFTQLRTSDPDKALHYYEIEYEIYEKSSGNVLINGIFSRYGIESPWIFHPTPYDYYDYFSAKTFGIRIIKVRGITREDHQNYYTQQEINSQENDLTEIVLEESSSKDAVSLLDDDNA